MTKYDTNMGFSVVELLLILVVVGILGFTGWYVYHAEQTSDKDYSAATNSTVPTFKRRLSNPTIATGPSQGLDTYTNPTLGFSFEFPTTAQAYNGCGQNSSVHATDGSLIPAPTAYIATPGPTSLTVLNDGDNFYIVPAKVYELTGESYVTVDGNQYPRASGCEATTNTTQLIQQDKNQANQTTFPSTYITDAAGLSLIAKTVKQGAELNGEVQTIFSDNSLQVSKLTPDSAGSWDDLSFTCSQHVSGLTGSVQPCAYTGGSYTLRYYPTKNLLIFWNTGQGCNLLQSDAASAQCYDPQIIKSLKLL
ncbi:MAG TPA: hypothetical protein VMB52_02925 [Verrucomicrobiae bacterium]|nr:hypothetical protein [Verrucomicrobiae bacterium]